MTIKIRVEHLEAVRACDEQPRGIKYTVDGVEAQSYRLEVGGQTVKTITRETGESQETFEARASTLLNIQAYEQRNRLLSPIMWADMPPIPRSGNCISPATGKPIRVTFGGEI